MTNSNADPLLFIRACVLPTVVDPSSAEPTQEQLDLVEPFRAELKAALDQFLPGPSCDQEIEVRDRGRKLIESARSLLRRIYPQSLRVQFNDAVWEQARAFEKAWSEWRWYEGRAYRRRRPRPLDAPPYLKRYQDWCYRRVNRYNIEKGFWNPPGT